MNLNEMTIEQLEARLSEIAAEIDGLESIEAVNERSAEFDAIKSELENRAALESKKQEIRGAVAAGDGEIIEEKVEERKMENTVEIRNSAEYIDAYAKYIKTGDASECRALLTTNVSGGTVAVPDMVEERVRTAWEKNEILARVKKTYIKGNLQVGFERSSTAAVVHTEGADAPAEETLLLGIVNLTPASIKKWITISDEAMDLRGAEFVNYIYDELTYRIAKAAADLLISKIVAAPADSTATAAAAGVVSADTITATTIASAIGLLSDEASNPVIIMNKGTYAAFRAVQAAGGFAYDVFEGCTVLFTNSLPTFDAATAGQTYAIVGDLAIGAQANFPNGEEITIKVDELSLAEKDLVKFVGREFVAVGVVAPNAFTKIAKSQGA